MRALRPAAAILLLALMGGASADYIDLPVKWSQIPWDPDGKDWLSDCSYDGVMADDFLCEEEEEIVALRWWGSYIGEQDPREDGWTGPFHIGFHLSEGEHPYSVPGSNVHQDTVTAQEVFVGNDNSGEPVYRYDAYLKRPFDQWAFSQQSPNIGELFLVVCKPTEENWGWHEVVAPAPHTRLRCVGRDAQRALVPDRDRHGVRADDDSRASHLHTVGRSVPRCGLYRMVPAAQELERHRRTPDRRVSAVL